MENIKYQVALLWIEDEQVTYSIHSTEKIQVPRKEAWQYEKGERVQARWGKRLHVAEVIAVDRIENKAKLEALGLETLLHFQKKQKELPSEQAADLVGQEVDETATAASVAECSRQELDVTVTAARVADLGRQGVNEKTAEKNDIDAKKLLASTVKSSEKAKTIEVIDVNNSQKTEEVRSSGLTHHGGFCGKCKEICRCKDISRLKERVKELESFKKSVTEEMRKMKEEMVLMRASLPSNTLGSPRPLTPSDMAPPLLPSAHPSSPCSAAAITSSPSPSPGHSTLDVAALLARVAHLDATKMQQTVKILAHEIFTVNELLNNSLSGKKSPHSKEVVRPPLDANKVELFKACIQRHLPTVQWKDVREKFQNLQKQERMKFKK